MSSGFGIRAIRRAPNHPFGLSGQTLGPVAAESPLTRRVHSNAGSDELLPLLSRHPFARHIDDVPGGASGTRCSSRSAGGSRMGKRRDRVVERSRRLTEPRCIRMNTPGETVTLDFDGGSKKELSLSGAASVGAALFLAPDEGSASLRLRPDGSGSYGRRASFPLRALLPLPGGAEDELDLEGMDYADGYLWVVGSHGGVRTKIDDDTDHEDAPGLL